MLECQEEQGNPRNVSIFESRKSIDLEPGGFDWYRTKEKGSFWYKVINNKNFNLFFETYPKKQEYQELKNNKNMQNNKKDNQDNSQEFRVGDEVIDIITRQRGKILQINTNNGTCPIYVSFNGEELYTYTLDGRYYGNDKYPRLLHYRDDYDYDVIDFNNLPKRQEPKRWRAEKNRIYYYVNFYTKDWFLPDETYDYYTPMDHDNYYSGNYLQTKEEAQEVADKLNKHLQELLNTIK